MTGTPVADPAVAASQARRLAALTAELKRWADVNPGLRPLYGELARLAAEMSEAGQPGSAAGPPQRPAPVLPGTARTCPACKAMPGYPCRNRSGQTLWHYVHKARREL